MRTNNITRLLIVGITLGLAWAIRGSFGHEWGASWAGAMGVFSLIAISKNKNWLNNAPILVALGAIGWAVGGISSYGIVIGYCRGTTFINVLYGYAMLAIIGGLYGFIGGGFLGLGLESDKKKKPDWANLLTQMIAAGVITWGLLIYELEWFMTPPRSELWAAVFGASIALGWFLWRGKYFKSLRVALYSALGAGFGFAFGNFIQVLGSASEISYNWWNVMEFTLGLFGGLGMAYAVFTSNWTEEVSYSKKKNLFSLLFLFVLIPFINLDQALTIENFVKLSNLQSSLAAEGFAINQVLFSWAIFLTFTIIAFIIWKKYQIQDDEKKSYFIKLLFFANSLYYIFFLILKNGLLYKGFSFSDSNTLYVPILMLIGGFMLYDKKNKSIPYKNELNTLLVDNWKFKVICLFVSLIVITLISIFIHDGLPGAHLRYQ